MANLSEKQRRDYVKRMFNHIAMRYVLANRWMTWGQDVKWRRKVLDLAALPKGGKILDVGTGTGDLAMEALRRDRSATAVGVDFTEEMMRQGRKRKGSEWVGWVNGDALELPFKAGYFDAVVSGYLLRNVIDVERALSEQHRVLKPHGRMVCLDTTPLPDDLWHLPARLYMQKVIPIIGKAVSGDGKAYKYLPQSTERFLDAKELAECMLKVGFKDVAYQRLMGGTMAIHWGVK